MGVEGCTYPYLEEERPQPARPGEHQARFGDHLLQQARLAVHEGFLSRHLAHESQVQLEENIQSLLNRPRRAGRPPVEEQALLLLPGSLAPQEASALRLAQGPAKGGAQAPGRDWVGRDRLLSAAGARAARAAPRSGPR